MKRKGMILCCLVLLFSFSRKAGSNNDYEKVEQTFQVTSDKPLEVMLDVDAGEVLVTRSMEARIGIVSMQYTQDRFRERIDFNETKNRLIVRLDKRDWHKRVKKNRHGEDKNRARVEVKLPYDVTILFDSRVKAGEVTMEMGGLRLKEFSLTNWAGDVEVRFDEPNSIVMDFLDIHVKIGEARFVKLGNARFEEADINGGIGEMDVDFTGNLLGGSNAKVDLDIGEASVLLPRNIGIRMHIAGGWSFLSEKNVDDYFYRRGGSYYSENYDEFQKKFSICITPGLGELNVRSE